MLCPERSILETLPICGRNKVSMKTDEIKDYLKTYPRLRKWINECPICHAIGYKPEMPEHISGEFSIAGKNIRKMLKPMAVDEIGFCLICSKLRK